MKQKIYQIDAFADTVFTGNPAAVCVMDQWLPDATMQQIATENNLAETAFVVADGSQYTIRWFTPTMEVDLCGHATLASAYVLYEYYGVEANPIAFHSPRSGRLAVSKGDHGQLILDFPADTLKEVEEVTDFTEALGARPLKTFLGKTDYLLIYKNQEALERMQPNFLKLAQVEARGVIVSAPGNSVDFVSRFFAPQCGINEDPVTGSAHTTLTPYWSKALGKSSLTARQISARGGNLHCEVKGDRISISGKACPYLIGEIVIPDA